MLKRFLLAVLLVSAASLAAFASRSSIAAQSSGAAGFQPQTLQLVCSESSSQVSTNAALSNSQAASEGGGWSPSSEACDERCRATLNACIDRCNANKAPGELDPSDCFGRCADAQKLCYSLCDRRRP